MCWYAPHTEQKCQDFCKNVFQSKGRINDYVSETEEKRATKVASVHCL